MKNIPKVIYLQVGEYLNKKDFAGTDFNSLCGVTWNTGKIDKHDIKYILSKRNFKKHKQEKQP